MKKYTSTETLDKDFLKVDGSNIDDKKSEFGKNVGIDKINLSNPKSSTELVQAKAVIDYLKGTGENSVKISDNAKTVATGKGSIAISIGKGSIVTGASSIALGENNKVLEAQSDNEIKGRDTIAIGSRIKSAVSNAIILENDSEGEENTVSVGGYAPGKQRRIINVSDPTKANDAANKNYVDGMLKKAKEEANKTAMKYDDSKNVITLGGKNSQHAPVVIDNLRSGLGIDDIKNGGIASAKQGKTLDLVKKLVAGELDKNSLHKAVNVADLKALATAGLNFAGNNSDSLVHKNLGETLEIVGQGLKKEKAADFKGTDGNIAVKADSTKTKLEVSLSEDLKGLKSAEFKNDKGTVNIQGDEIALKDKDGKAIIATLNDKGLTVGNSTNNTDKTHTVYGKNGVTVHGKDGKSAVSLTTKNENGKETATLAFSKGADGKYIGAITGLADLDDKSDGSSVANKNYVDDKVQSINGNRPFVYYLDGKKSGERARR
ncbi:hypothetical protein CFY87_05250 [Actinobacillus seminis]|uniref:YadA domain-containing protein n=1 Tax=Actinobacillus seminis TaxID=722 RepID=A0A263HDT9_9PAST|nr:hypothetical protein [Actinobacillus seminis]OZN25118.1 hypothetical protein CFY87_05250 [Actinobacillus seminis]SUU33828.1 YadA domain-containing protein [Actinobacillus seminis]